MKAAFFLFCIFSLPQDISSILGSLASNPDVGNIITQVEQDPSNLAGILPLIEQLLTKLSGIMQSTGGALPQGTIQPGASTAATLNSSSPGTGGSSSIPSSIPSQYASYWNKVPTDLQTKLLNAVASKKLSYAQIQNVVATKDYAKGLSLLTSAGFTLNDALELKSALGE